MLIPWDYKKTKLRKGYALLINMTQFLKCSVREKKKIFPFKITNYSHSSPQRQEQQPVTAKTGGQSHSLIYTSPSPVTTVVPTLHKCCVQAQKWGFAPLWKVTGPPPLLQSSPLSMQNFILLKAGVSAVQKRASHQAGNICKPQSLGPVLVFLHCFHSPVQIKPHLNNRTWSSGREGEGHS